MKRHLEACRHTIELALGQLARESAADVEDDPLSYGPQGAD